jgi:hypothetical protein
MVEEKLDAIERAIVDLSSALRSCDENGFGQKAAIYIDLALQLLQRERMAPQPDVLG